jgi:hypothetical protein
VLAAARQLPQGGIESAIRSWSRQCALAVEA